MRPRNLRHTFAYRLAAETGKDAYELERKLGHGSQRYIQRYTNQSEDVAVGYVEEFWCLPAGLTIGSGSGAPGTAALT